MINRNSAGQKGETRNIQNDEKKQGPTTETTVPSKAVLSNWRKNFPDKEFITTKPLLQEMLKELLQRGGGGEEAT